MDCISDMVKTRNSGSQTLAFKSELLNVDTQFGLCSVSCRNSGSERKQLLLPRGNLHCERLNLFFDPSFLGRHYFLHIIWAGCRMNKPFVLCNKSSNLKP